MSASLRALVVEDDAVSREATIIALEEEGFICRSASDGLEAIDALDRSRFDVLVTDLRMPKRHGHSLAVEVIGRGSERPLVVVLTGVLDPRLLKDLVAHEVDDVAFKPADLTLFAAKIRALCERRSRQRQLSIKLSETTPHSNQDSAAAGNLDRCETVSPVSQEEIDRKLQEVSKSPDGSKSSLDIFNLIDRGNTTCQQVAAAMRHQPTLIAELLRFANSSLFAPSLRKYASLEQVVVRLGQKRVGELTLVASAFASITQEKIPFFPLDRIRKRCLATEVCLEMLLENCKCISPTTGLFSAAALQSMGRLLAGSLFPELYKQMLKQCATQRKSLSELERSVFPQSPGEMAASTLSSWGVPDLIHRPLRHVHQTFQALASIDEPLRHRVEIMKTAEFLGSLAASHFDGWDLIDIPPATMLSRLGVRSLETIVRRCREDLKQMTSSNMQRNLTEDNQSEVPQTSLGRPIAYKRLRSDSVDLVHQLLSSSGSEIVEIPLEVPDEENVVVNALGAAVHQVMKCLRKPRLYRPVIITEALNAARLEGFGHVVVMPCAYSRLSELLGLPNQ